MGRVAPRFSSGSTLRQIFTIEHNKNWYARVSATLAQLGLTNCLYELPRGPADRGLNSFRHLNFSHRSKR